MVACLVWSQYRSVRPGISAEQPVHIGPARPPASAARRDAPWQPNPPGKAAAATTYPSYLHTAEVADLLHVSPKTVSRWAKEGRLPFLKTLGGHRRYPEAEIRDLAEGLREETTA
jgi:excisionase family DNA binding protein